MPDMSDMSEGGVVEGDARASGGLWKGAIAMGIATGTV
jgi:hypothetical protein